MKRLFLLLFMVTATLAGAWQPVNENAPEPAREFRAAWVATVFNLDWPSKAGLPASQQKAELLSIIEQASKLRLNAIILQVRPNGDALYKSKLEPWSVWLSGAGTDPGYDPLAFAIAEAHRRGIEIHAWFNPFRATVSSRPVGRGHVSRRQPGWILRAGSTTILNPGKPEARGHVLRVERVALVFVQPAGLDDHEVQLRRQHVPVDRPLALVQIADHKLGAPPCRLRALP